ncbi:DUF4349 domain-containing protein [Chryseobacterium sp. GMJ5]|uniref:DUF4349 domain-containing protein n=1 Tax=Chryseobacterium gilvum TaxID=2976534 RepID=A0ABT2W0L1_9FLAO|nr:DUF4349 domain-containing protein [Chryseobacterium gilvum]MCU7614702.1 DUF4349 domain-containing protein [Chryseobacterium gilvum]
MKTTYIRLSLVTVLLLGMYSCKKGEANVNDYEASVSADSAAAVSDDISSAATMNVKDKQFIKTAEVNMDVKDVYDATVSIEKTVQELGGFVINSNLRSNIVAEDSYNTSDNEATLIRKYQTENSMQVRVPVSKLGGLLTLINDKKLFLNARIINAEDVTSSIRYAEMEEKRISKTEENISALKTNKDKVKMSNENRAEKNQQQLANLEVTDHLKYSTVDIFIKEPKLRIAEIAVTNTSHIDNKYQFNFIYDVKDAFISGFYLIQRIFVGLITVWPLLIVAGIIFYFFRKRKSIKRIDG